MRMYDFPITKDGVFLYGMSLKPSDKKSGLNVPQSRTYVP